MTNPPQTGQPKLTYYTFNDLLEEIDAAAGKATSATAKDSWSGLRSIVEEVAQIPATGDFNPADDATPWWITEVEVQHFRGIPSLIVSLPRSPGITVIHGANGSGKSSLCDAIDVGLHQNAQASVGRLPGSGGNEPIWEPVLVNTRRTDTSGPAQVRLNLQTQDWHTLNLTTSFADDGIAVTAVAVKTTATTSHPVSLGSGWESALRNYRPIYSYAAWEQHIRTAGELKQYLQTMLILGGCFDSVERHIQVSATSANAAEANIKASLGTTQTELDQLANRFDRPSVSLPTSIADEKAESWWEATGLHTSEQWGSVGAPLEIDPTQLIASAHRLRSQLTRLTADDLLTRDLASALNQLNSAVRSDGGPCPVCGSQVDWRQRLERAVAANLDAVAARSLARSDLNSFLRAMAPQLRDLAANAGVGEQSLHEAAERANKLESALWKEDESLAMHEMALQLLQIIESDAFREDAAGALGRVSAEASWRAAQAEALRPFVECWRDNESDAAGAASWVRAAKSLESLRKRLVEKRQAALSEATNDLVVLLLGDAGLEVTALTIQKTKADLGLKDAGGDLSLAMLSAGQRNAVILAPALAAAQASPLAFLVVDDPVHAFDALRVDAVAKQLLAIAKTKRVLVLTHDERLREHLLAGDDQDQRSIKRDASTGEVTVTASEALWSALLKDAESLLGVDKSAAAQLGVTNRVRSLCRQAIDNALRLLLVREATDAEVDPTTWLEKLDKVYKTKDRLSKARTLLGESPAAEQPKACLVHMPDATWRAWNAAAHDNPPTSTCTSDEIALARDACERLLL